MRLLFPQVFHRISPVLTGQARVHLNERFPHERFAPGREAYLRVRKLRTKLRPAAVIERTAERERLLLRACNGKNALRPAQQIATAPGDIRFSVKGDRSAAIAHGHAPFPVCEQMHLWLHGVRPGDLPGGRRHTLGALRRFAQLHIAEDGGAGRDFFLQQAARRRHAVIPHEAVLHNNPLSALQIDTRLIPTWCAI